MWTCTFLQENADKSYGQVTAKDDVSGVTVVSTLISLLDAGAVGAFTEECHLQAAAEVKRQQQAAEAQVKADEVAALLNK